MKNILTIIVILCFSTYSFGQKSEFKSEFKCVLGNCQSEFSIIKYPNGSKYIGEIKNGKFTNHGIFYFKDGSKYIGEWKNHQFHGEGKFYYKDGREKVGIWQYGKMTTVRATNEGCISGDCTDGYGVFIAENGRKHINYIQKGELTRSVIYYEDGSKYVGTTTNYQKEGNGIFYKADGSIEEGKWARGQFLGANKQGKGCISGNCNNGQGTYIYNNSTKYYGSFANSLANGKGICYYADGDVYVGYWKEHNFHGEGVLYGTDGTVEEGNWTNGKLEVKSGSERMHDFMEDGNTTTKVWAILVGVSSYKHMKPLRYTDDDAYRFHSFLKSPEGGAIPDERMSVLVDESATKEAILKKLKDVATRAGKNDCILFYFSGHGMKGAFLPIDFDGTNIKLEHSEINNIFSRSKAKTKIVIADACHSGSFDTNAKDATVNSMIGQYYKALENAHGGTALLLSSKAEETSIESNGLRQGIFSHFLIRGLKGAGDENDNKIVTVQELFRYVEANVSTYTNGYQTPIILGKYDKNIPLGVIR